MRGIHLVNEARAQIRGLAVASAIDNEEYGLNRLDALVEDDDICEACFGEFYAGMGDDDLAQIPFEISKALLYAISVGWVEARRCLYTGEPVYTTTQKYRELDTRTLRAKAQATLDHDQKQRDAARERVRRASRAAGGAS